MAAPRHVLLTMALLLGACGAEPLAHGLDEAQANEVLLALDEGGLTGRKLRDEGTDAGWAVVVEPRDETAARRVLAERELPRPRPPGFGEVFAGGGMVPTPVEEHARYLHALSGELSRSLESLDGVVEARVHVGLPQEDPLRPGDRRPARAAVLLRCRPLSCASIRSMEAGIRSLVAGAADGLAPDGVSLLVAEAATPPPRPAPPGRAWRWVGAGILGLLAFSLAGLALMRSHRWSPRRSPSP